MNMVALGHPNVYLCLSLLVPWAVTAPYKFAHILGEAMRFVGPDRIIWGTDSAGYGLQIGMAAMGLAQFQIPDELQCKYGYLPLTDEDKRKIFGGNLGKLLGIDTTHRRGGKASEEAPQERPLEMISQVQRPAEASVTAVADRSVLPATEEFEVVMSTPIGSINGKVITHIEGERISGVISFMGQENEFKNGIIDESGNVTFSGEMKTPIGKMAYTSTGKMVDGKIEAVAKTKLGNIEIRSK